MSANIILLQIGDSDRAEAANYNRILHTDTFPISLLDEDGSATTFTIDATSAPTGSSQGTAVTLHGIPQLVLEGVWFIDPGPAVLELSGTIPAGKQIKEISALGAANQDDASRMTEVTIGGVTIVHDSRDHGVNAPITFTSGLGSLPLDISFEPQAGSIFG